MTSRVNAHRYILTTLTPLLSVFIAAQVSANNHFFYRLSQAAIERTHHEIRYDGRYVAIDYPNGDVPNDIGVCTDVVIRSYRSLGVDLQQLVHEDIRKAFQQYPAKRIWQQNQPDTNIDHRRVPNLQTFFTRHGEILTISNKPQDYAAGDVVTWMLPGNLPHIGIVTHLSSEDGLRPLIAHNIGAGPKIEDSLFSYTITGHFRYTFSHE